MQNFENSTNNETIIKTINKKNFVYLPFLKIINETVKFEDVDQKKFDIFSNIPYYMKINLQPLMNKKFLLRIQDLYHEQNNETIDLLEKIIKDFRKKENCDNSNSTKSTIYHYDCIQKLLGGLISEKEKLYQGEKALDHEIFTVLCRKKIFNSIF